MSRPSPLRLVLVAVLAFALGWAASVAWSATAPLRLTEHLAGTVAVVNEDGTKLCVEPDGVGGQRCGGAYRRPDAPRLQVGDRVAVAVGRLRLANGNEEEIFVILPAE